MMEGTPVSDGLISEAQRLSMLEEKIALAWQMRNKEHTLALALAEECFSDTISFAQSDFAQLAEEATVRRQATIYAKSLLIISICKRQTGEFDVALSNAFEALPLFRILRIAQSEASAMNNIGLIYLAIADYAKALDYFNQCLTLARGLGAGFLEAEASLLTNIGEVYRQLREFDKAIEYFDKSANCWKELGNAAKQFESLENLGLIYQEMGQFADALIFYEQSLSNKRKTNDRLGEAITLLNIGSLYEKVDDDENALSCFEQSLTIARSVDAKPCQASALINIGNIHRRKYETTPNPKHSSESLDMAFAYYRAALSIAEELNARNLIYLAHEAMYVIYKEQGQFEKALLHHEQFHIIKESVFNQESDERLRNLQVASETEQAKQEAEIQRLKSVELAGALKELKEIQDELISGINYARTIQQTILPTNEELRRAFADEYFLLYKPKDIVSGDFYWLEQLGEATLVAVCDCTGHGVPGAFMSMMCSDLLNQIVVERNIHSPADILAELHRAIRKALRQEQSSTQDGMDICLLRIEPEQVIFSGAKRPLFMVSLSKDRQEKTFVELKGDRFSIGGFQKEDNRAFTNHVVSRRGEVVFFLSSDGYADQCNEQFKSIGTRRFKEILQANAALRMEEQKNILQQTLETHQGAELQRDDITVFGIRLS